MRGPGRADGRLDGAAALAHPARFPSPARPAMRTLVVQSYRTRDVAAWIAQCLASVRDWAARRGFAYDFVDDRFFDYAPPWVRERCARQLLPLTDVARLYLLRERLDAGYERVIWVDADVLVFAPEAFTLAGVHGYSLCREVWLRVGADGAAQIEEKVNNAVIVADRGHPFLDFWRFATEEILRAHAAEDIGPLSGSTVPLTELARLMPVRVLPQVGLFSPPLVREAAAGGGPLLRAWAQHFGQPIAAVNLCASLQDRSAGGDSVGAAELEGAVRQLLHTRGAVVNAALQPAPRYAWG